jgi:DNA sulfur modification protein DndD
MKVSIIEFETIGLRCPDAKVSFKNKGTGSVINLLQMPNGTGKTTMIKLLSGTLTGEIENWTHSETKEFMGKSNKTNTGEFRLELSIEESNKHAKNISFLVRFDFEHGVTELFTIRNVESGLEKGHLPPPSLRQFISQGCVDVFCFQGDKIKDIIDSQKEDAEVTINAFFGFDDINTFLNDIKQYHREATQSGRPTNQGNMDSLENLLSTWEERSEVLKIRLDTERNDRTEVKKNLEQLEGQYIKIINASTEQAEKQEELNSAKDKAEDAVRENLVSLWDELKNPFILSDSLLDGLHEFRTNLEAMKLPGGSREFFEELIELDDGCICGEPLIPKRVSHIRSKIEEYLSTDEASIVNTIKEQINETYKSGHQSKHLNDEFSKLEDSISTQTFAETDLATFLEDIKNKASAGDAKIIKDYGDASTKKNDIDKAIKKLTKNYIPDQTQRLRPAECFSYDAAENAIEELTIELGKMSNRRNITAAYELIRDVINVAKENSLKEIKSLIKDSTNEKIKETLPAGSPLEVIELDKYLKLGWNDIAQTEASGAQNIIIAYSFARSVLEQADIEFPLIVDHPVANVDKNNRRTLGSKLGLMMHQFIGFLIDTERPGFLEGVQESGDVRYISLFSNIEGNKPFIDEIERLPDKEYTKSENGYISYNKDFFVSNVMGDH